MVTRVGLLFSLAWITRLPKPLFALWGHELSGRTSAVAFSAFVELLNVRLRRCQLAAEPVRCTSCTVRQTSLKVSPNGVHVREPR
jgi:hypothetical protein